MKKETIQDFLLRGGAINKVPTIGQNYKPMTKSTVVQYPNIISLGEADILYGKEKSQKEKKLKGPTLDVDLLPEALKAKILMKLKSYEE